MKDRGEKVILCKRSNGRSEKNVRNRDYNLDKKRDEKFIG